jgi:hypothetical protein
MTRPGRRPKTTVILGCVWALCVTVVTAPVPAAADIQHEANQVTILATHKANHPCSLLTTPTIRHLVGLSASGGTQGGALNPGDAECSWDLGTTSGVLNLTYEPSITKGDLTAPQSNGELGASAKRVSGVGSVAYVTCTNQQGAPPLCELRASGHGKTLDFVLTAPGNQKALTKDLVKVGKAVFGEL